MHHSYFSHSEDIAPLCILLLIPGAEDSSLEAVPWLGGWTSSQANLMRYREQLFAPNFSLYIVLVLVYLLLPALMRLLLHPNILVSTVYWDLFRASWYQLLLIAWGCVPPRWYLNFNWWFLTLLFLAAMTKLLKNDILLFLLLCRWLFWKLLLLCLLRLACHWRWPGLIYLRNRVLLKVIVVEWHWFALWRDYLTVNLLLIMMRRWLWCAINGLGILWRLSSITST